MELPTWKGAYCLHRVNPLSMGLFNHARGDMLPWGIWWRGIAHSSNEDDHSFHEVHSQRALVGVSMSRCTIVL